MSSIATIGGAIGAINEDNRDAAAAFAVNTRVIGINGFVYRYVQAGEAITASQTVVAVDSAGQATATTGAFVNTTAFADNEYGWLRVAAALAPDT